MDATLSTKKGAQVKISKILKRKKRPIIYAIIPDDLIRAFIAFLNRERKFSESHFYKTHSGSRRTILWLAQNYSNIKLNIVISFYTSDQRLQFKKIEFDHKNQLIAYLTSLQVTETDIINLVQDQL